MANTYEVGDRVRLRTSTPFQDAAGDAFDPDVVTFEIQDPDGDVGEYVYGTDSEVSKIATGDYACDVDVDTAGEWRYYVAGEETSGENRGAARGGFHVIGKFT